MSQILFHSPICLVLARVMIRRPAYLILSNERHHNYLQGPSKHAQAFGPTELTQSFCLPGLPWGREISVNLCMAAITHNFAQSISGFSLEEGELVTMCRLPAYTIVEANEDRRDFL